MADSNQPLPSTTSTEQPQSSFVPRLIGIITGAIGGFSITKKLRNASLRQFVSGQIETGSQTIKTARDEVLGVVANKHGEYVKAGFVDSAKVLVEEAQKEIETQSRNAIKALRKYNDKEHFPNTFNPNKFKELETAILENANLAKLRAGQKLLDKPVFNEIIKRLELGMKQSEHKAALYCFGAVSTVGIGLLAYKAAKKLLHNPQADTHVERLAERPVEAQMFKAS